MWDWKRKSEKCEGRSERGRHRREVKQKRESEWMVKREQEERREKK